MNGFETILPFLKPIEHLILDDSISEVMVNGPDRIFIEKAGFIEVVRGVSLGEKSLMVAVKNIARRLGDDISESKPILDSRLPDGSRVAAVIPPCSVNGVTLTIRKFNARHFGVEDLVQAGTLEQSLANQLENYILDRRNFLIAGGTGSGKTTMLNVLGKFIPPDERVLLIEDTSEIHLAQDNLVRLEARQPQNESSWVKYEEEKPSISCSSSTPGILGAFRPSMPLPQGRALLDSRAACCRAAWICLIARSRQTSVTP